MSDSQTGSPEPFDQKASSGTHPPLRLGYLLLLAGNLLVIAAFFSPWFEVFKLNDPSFPFPTRGYSPWMVLRDGHLGSLGVATWIFSLLILGMALGSLALALSHTARGRARAIGIAGVSALISLLMVFAVVPGIPFGLSFDWPYLNSTAAYGVVLVVAGLVSVLIALSTLTEPRAKWQ